jgi:DNA topoisomerase IA
MHQAIWFNRFTVYCNTKFGFTADETLKIVQTLYEQKSSHLS